MEELLMDGDNSDDDTPSNTSEPSKKGEVRKSFGSLIGKDLLDELKYKTFE